MATTRFGKMFLSLRRNLLGPAHRVPVGFRYRGLAQVELVREFADALPVAGFLCKHKLIKAAQRTRPVLQDSLDFAVYGDIFQYLIHGHLQNGIHQREQPQQE